MSDPYSAGTYTAGNNAWHRRWSGNVRLTLSWLTSGDKNLQQLMAVEVFMIRCDSVKLSQIINKI